MTQSIVCEFNQFEYRMTLKVMLKWANHLRVQVELPPASVSTRTIMVTM